jgi:ABC-type transporter Mla MlaB component
VERLWREFKGNRQPEQTKAATCAPPRVPQWHLPCPSRAVAVLKISAIRKPEGTWLQLEGSLTGSWVDELRRTAERALANSQAVLLDLQQLWYMDLEGVALIRELLARQVVPMNGSPFIKRQLEMNPGGDESPR